jgi:hypothetical protein
MRSRRSPASISQPVYRADHLRSAKADAWPAYVTWAVSWAGRQILCEPPQRCAQPTRPPGRGFSWRASESSTWRPSLSCTIACVSIPLQKYRKKNHCQAIRRSRFRRPFVLTQTACELNSSRLPRFKLRPAPKRHTRHQVGVKTAVAGILMYIHVKIGMLLPTAKPSGGLAMKVG